MPDTLFMDYFLEKIAGSLHTEFGNTLNRHCLVFPNRRAGLYFLKHLAAIIDKPVWVPSVFTINELFRSYSSLQTAGNEILLFELYKVYRGIQKSPESFDEFYFWGDMLLNDFDDVDKYMVDASLIFRNVEDLKNIDHQFGGLTESQVEIIRRFWINFNPDKPTNEKTGFISIWSLLNELYSGFRNSLKNQNLAYEGMIFRELAEKHDIDFASEPKWDMVHFVGFNALNECEKTIMLRFQKAGKARFYWDYDNSYILENSTNSAGFFLKDNLKKFGNDMPTDWSYDTLLSVGSPVVKRRVIDTSSDVAQVKLISKLIDEIPDITPANAHHTAVVLADESLLMPVLTSLPEGIDDINITMGHPLKQTLVYTLIRHLMDLQRTASVSGGIIRFSYSEVISILKHTLMSGLMSESDKEIVNEIIKTNLVWVPSLYFAVSENLAKVFTKPATPVQLSEYLKDILSLIALNEVNIEEGYDNNPVQRNIRNEFIYRVVLAINRLEKIVKSPDVSFTTDTYIRILDRMLRMQSVPFSGEPLTGIQIMGILETRTLDFKNLIILSVNEGILPAVSSGSSFIPFNLREAFGLPSVNHQESIYAYHFYRLLQKAENVTFTYNSNSEGLRSGEISRFLTQMRYDKILQPLFTDLNFEIKTHGSIRESIEKNEKHLSQLSSQFLNEGKGRILSPSAINTFLNCSMKFYYQYVNLLKERETISADIDPAMLGNMLHDIMKNLYMDYRDKVLTIDFFDSLIRDKKTLLKAINEAIITKFNYSENNSLSGNELIVRDVIHAYLIRILSTDKKLAPVRILNLEDSYSFIVSIPVADIPFEIKVGGKVDRIDVVDGVTRIVDYKTGTVADTIASLDDLFSDDRKKDYDGWLQTLLYCEAYLANYPGTLLRPSVYKIKKLKGELASDKLRLKADRKIDIEIDDYKVVREVFTAGLTKTISRIFSRDESFVMTSDIRGKCSFCPYKVLCMR
jgi:hypothetical protein